MPVRRPGNKTHRWASTHILTPIAAESSQECRMRNDRQSYLRVVRDLVHAQFELADQELSARLWQDVADRDLDRGRILHLLYNARGIHQDDAVMGELDAAYVGLVDPSDP